MPVEQVAPATFLHFRDSPRTHHLAKTRSPIFGAQRAIAESQVGDAETAQ